MKRLPGLNVNGDGTPDVPEPAEENVDPNKMDKEWSKEALEASAPKKRRSHWYATPAEWAAVGEP